jgi:glycolate oxidase
MPLTQSLAARLAAIVGARRVLERPGELRSYESDGLPGYQCTPSLAVFPGTREETIDVVRAMTRWIQRKPLSFTGRRALDLGE